MFRIRLLLYVSLSVIHYSSIADCNLLHDRAIRSIHFPGHPAVKDEVIRLLFDLCSKRVELKNGKEVSQIVTNSSGQRVAVPDLLIKVPASYLFYHACSID